MVMIALLTLPWIHLMQSATARPRVLADDLLFTAIGEDCDAVLAHAFRLTADFMDRAGARLALPTKDKLGKCFVCAADTTTRDRIRRYTWGSDKVSLPVLNTFRDLGSHMNVSCRVDGATLTARITSALTSLGRLRHMPIPRAHKVTAVLTHILPKALYGAEATHVSQGKLAALRAAIANVIGPRSLRASSDLAFALRGIVAGSGTATTEMRLTMITIVDAALLLFPAIAPTLFVDDLSLEPLGLEEEEAPILDSLSGFAVAVMKRIGQDGMEVNRTKSLVSASHPTMAQALTARMGNLALTVAHRVKSLGVGLAAGTARNTLVQNSRLKNFKKRLPRYRMLRRLGADTAMLVELGYDDATPTVELGPRFE